MCTILSRNARVTVNYSLLSTFNWIMTVRIPLLENEDVFICADCFEKMMVQGGEKSFDYHSFFEFVSFTKDTRFDKEAETDSKAVLMEFSDSD